MNLKKLLSAALVVAFLLPTALGFSTPISAASVTGSANEAKIYNFLKNTLKVNDAVACGVLANIYKESSFRPDATYTESDGSVSYGICQWNKSRQDNLKTFCANNGYDYTTIEGQLWFLKYELEGSEKSAWGTVKSVSNTADGAYLAGYNWARYFERCNSKYYEERANLSLYTYWKVYGPVTAVTTYATITAGTYYIKNLATGKYLTVDGGADANNTNISVADYNGSASQQYKISAGTFGYKLRALCSDSRVANIYANVVSSGKNVCLWEETGDNSQLWFFETAGSGYVIRCVQNQDCVLDVSGTNVLVKTIVPSTSQTWILQTEAQAKLDNCTHKNTSVLNRKEPTCYSEGYSGDTVCNDCGVTVSVGTAVATTAHTYESSVVIPTPDAKGYTKYVCNVCGFTYTDNSADYSAETYPTAYVSDAYATRTESVTLTVSVKNLPEITSLELSDFIYNTDALSLDSVEWVASADYAQASINGAQAKYQTPTQISGDVLKLTFTVKADAPNGQYSVSCAVKASYPVIGESDAVILAALDSGVVEVGACLHRNGVEYVAKTAPGCTENGYLEHYVCTVCNTTFSDSDGKNEINLDDIVISPNGHDYESDYTLDVAPTQTEGGSRSIHCRNCDSRISVVEMIPCSEIVKGDYNGDGDVNMKDVLAIRKYLAFSEGEWMYFEAADTDGDAAVTMKDVLYIRKFLLGLLDD